ncbi:hypothetical protein P7C73_g4854, partial [Tremellales sp. Uapishka_1]
MRVPQSYYQWNNEKRTLMLTDKAEAYLTLELDGQTPSTGTTTYIDTSAGLSFAKILPSSLRDPASLDQDFPGDRVGKELTLEYHFKEGQGPRPFAVPGDATGWDHVRSRAHMPRDVGRPTQISVILPEGCTISSALETNDGSVKTIKTIAHSDIKVTAHVLKVAQG